MNDLLQYLNSIYPLSKEVLGHLKDTLKVRELPKKGYLLKAGHVCRHVYFIQKGLLRCFYTDDMSEVSSWFMKEGNVVVSVESFFDQKPSYESIQALEDCTLFCLEFNELEYIYKTFMEFNYVGRVLVQEYYMLSEQRLYTLRMKRAQERYTHLREHFSDLVQRVPAKYLASYLGITEETLSRIRGKKIN